MHIQACTLIYNLARKRENAKIVAWNEFQQHCTLSSLPPLLPLCTADVPRGPRGFCKHAVIPATLHQEENTSGLEIWTTKAELSTTSFARKQEQESQSKARGAAVPSAIAAWKDLLTQQRSFARGTISASSLLPTEPGASI